MWDGEGPGGSDGAAPASGHAPIRYTPAMRIPAVALAVVLLGSGGGAALAEDDVTAFPLLELPRIDTGEPVSTWSFRGTKLVLVQFASW